MPVICFLSSLMAQLVKKPHAMQETWVQSLGREDPLEKEMATHSSTLAWKSHGWRSLVATVHGVAKSRTRLSDFTFSWHIRLANISYFQESSFIPTSRAWYDFCSVAELCSNLTCSVLHFIEVSVSLHTSVKSFYSLSIFMFGCAGSALL